MAVLTPMQVAAAAYLGGFRGDEIATAVAVAKGESSFNTTARNSCCSGLWQIHRTAHADAIKAKGGEKALDNPATNAALAYQIYKGAGGWCTNGSPPNCNPWQAYGVSNGTGSWSSKLAQGKRAVDNLNKKVHSLQIKQRLSLRGQLEPMSYEAACRQILKDAGFDTDEGAHTPIEATEGAVGDVLQFFTFPKVEGLAQALADPHTWLRLAQVVMGGLLVIVAVVQLTGATKLAGVLPAGRIAKALK